MIKTLKIFGYIVLGLGILAMVSIKKIDRTPFEETEHYKKWEQQVSKMNFENSTGEFEIGWAKENITPLQPGPMAGYGKRKGAPYQSVHDSVYIRAISIKNGDKYLWFVASDMLIVPPNVVEKLKLLLDKDNIPLSSIHFGATHAHNSLGGWGNSLTGRLFAGSYDPNVEVRIAEKMHVAILKSSKIRVKGEIFYEEAVDKEDIRNRLEISDGKIDQEIRALKFIRSDGKKAKLVTYGAHSTVLNSATLQLSRDYPGVLVDSLEKSDVDFAMYMAGAVGSMGPIEKGKDDFDEVNNQANGVLSHLKTSIESPLSNIFYSNYFKIPLPTPTARISKNFGLRPWAFRILFGDYPTFLKVTKIGKTLILGMPCDFSGEIMIELDAYAKSQGLDLIITSFNGSYIGYVTSDRLYDRDLYETTTMSWYGYQNGGYFTKIVKDLVDRVGV